METLKESLDIHSITVADIARTYHGATSIFNKYNIDYCCGGKISLFNACTKVNVNPETVIEELLHTQHVESGRTIRFETWEPALLVNFIIQHHHAYVKQSIPEIQELLEKVYSVHGEEHTALKLIRENFKELSDELLQHLTKEEVVLFPAIISMFNQSKITGSTFDSALGLEQPMMIMEDEHEHAGNLIKAIRLLTENYTPPSFACPTFHLAYKRLQEFDQDLMQHIHLENNVLFYKVKKALHSNFVF